MWGSIGMVYSRGPPRETERETVHRWRGLVFKLGIGTWSPAAPCLIWATLTSPHSREGTRDGLPLRYRVHLNGA